MFDGVKRMRRYDSLRSVQPESLLGRKGRRAFLRAECGRGLGWKLDVFNLQRAVAAGKLEKARVRTLIFQPHSELEGWLRQPDGREVFVTSSPKDNIHVGKSRPVPPFSTPAGTRRFSD